MRGGGALGAHLPTPPPTTTMGSRVCLLTAFWGGGGLRGRLWGGGGGSVGTPTKVPQNGPHDALIILNIRKWGKFHPSASGTNHGGGGGDYQRS